MSTQSPEDSSGQQPTFETITDGLNAQEENGQPGRSRLAIGAAAATSAVCVAAGIYIWANSNNEKGSELPPTPTPIYTTEAPLPPEQPQYPPTALVNGDGVLRLAKESSDPDYESCADVDLKIVKQARADGDPTVVDDDDSFNDNKQAVLTTSAESVRKAFAAGYDNLTVSFVPEDENGSFHAEDAECAIGGPEALPVKAGKVWAAAGIGKEATIFSLIATNGEGDRVVLPTKLYGVQKPGSKIKAGLPDKRAEVPLY